jgi:hypothetical protein
MDEKAAIQSVGTILSGFLKSGRQPDEAETTRAQIIAIIEATIVTPEESTQRYKQRCDRFLETVIEAKGLPIRAVSGVQGDKSFSNTGGKRTAKNSTIPLQQILSQHAQCIENYRQQSRLYFDGEMNQLRDMLQRFLHCVSTDGPANKEAKREITTIKKAFRDLIKWDRFFSTVKAGSFVAAVRRTIELEGNPLAAIWRYSPMDEQGEFRNAYSHKDLDGRIYSVRGNWALEKGLMKPSPDGYIDAIAQPHEDFDCMCRYQWIYNLRSLPESMLTEVGRTQLTLAQLKIEELDREKPVSSEPTKSDRQLPRNAAHSGLLRRIMGWFGRGGP